jgi:hypothetical protein
MVNSDLPAEAPPPEASAATGAKGAAALAGLATAIVVAVWFAFYLLVFLPRTTGP